ncbi:hypothetical protein BLA29_003635 [Euroglyphus maynei]|uniref:Uncharacterized protein n=1 Tax=Euroglyphus maynei TaxID=6958 RepID=A0A1Y3AW02_EURMA|nr:hypothetical protein BLA29_003635 [Euroglyphus maynei]
MLNDMNMTDPYWLFNDVNNPLSLALGNDLSPFLRSTSASSSSSSTTMTIKEPPTPTNFLPSGSSSTGITNSTNVQSKYSLK